MFWVLKKVVGSNSYDSRTHLAWVKVYSRMLRIIVPTAVGMELQTGSTYQLKRLGMSDSLMFEDSRGSKEPSISKAEGEVDHLKSEKIRTAEPTPSGFVAVPNI